MKHFAYCLPDWPCYPISVSDLFMHVVIFTTSRKSKEFLCILLSAFLFL